MKGLIIEGVTASGKTSVIKHLQLELSKKGLGMSNILLSEHYTQRALEHLRDDGLLTDVLINKHIGGIVDNLEFYDKMINTSKFKDQRGSAEMFVILERFLLTHINSSILKENDECFVACFVKLHKLNFKQVILYIPPELMEERIFSTTKYRNDNWNRYLASIGDRDATLLHFLEWQEKLVNYANKFSHIIDTEIISIEHEDYKKYARMIFKNNFC